MKLRNLYPKIGDAIRQTFPVVYDCESPEFRTIVNNDIHNRRLQCGAEVSCEYINGFQGNEPRYLLLVTINKAGAPRKKRGRKLKNIK